VALAAGSNTGPPQIFNSDQEAQFTSGEFTTHVQAQAIRISMGERGQALFRFVKRLWRLTKRKRDIWGDKIFVAIGRASRPFPRPKRSVRLSPHSAFQFGSDTEQGQPCRCRLGGAPAGKPAIICFPP